MTIDRLMDVKTTQKVEAKIENVIVVVVLSLQ